MGRSPCRYLLGGVALALAAAAEEGSLAPSALPTPWPSPLPSPLPTPVPSSLFHSMPVAAEGPELCRTKDEASVRWAKATAAGATRGRRVAGGILFFEKK